jgi:3-oxoacyl-[acyl-carrier-protein] synthase II
LFDEKGEEHQMSHHRSDEDRVVITGMAAVTPLGLTVEETWQAMVEGKSGVDYITLFDASECPVRIAAEVKGFDPSGYIERKEARRMARSSQFTIVTAAQALEDAGLSTPFKEGMAERVGALLGTSIGGFDEIEEALFTVFTKGFSKVSPFAVAAGLPNMPTFYVCLYFNAQGYTSTISTACSAGTQAIGEAADVIRRGRVDVMITGGVEAMIVLSNIAGFDAMRALSHNNDNPPGASRPFDARRDGLVVGEGCAIFILERLTHARERGAKIYAEMLGQASSSDTYHVAAPDPEGRGAMRTMKWAIEDAGLALDDIDYINAHATATPLGDISETTAIKRLFGQRAYQMPVSATKSMIGHAFGAGGAIEALASVQAINTGIIHPTINYEHPDPECDLDCVPNKARQADVRYVLKNSFGFGGQNACLVLGRYEP